MKTVTGCMRKVVAGIVAALTVAGWSRAATLYWTANGNQSTAWNTTDQNWTQTGTADGVAPGPADGSVYTDGGVDEVIFKRDMPTAGRTITVRAAGARPRRLRVDTNGNWDFSGGLIDGPLYYNPNSGGSSNLRFNNYVGSMAFTAVTNGSFSSNIRWNFAGGPGAYRFCAAGAPIVSVGGYSAGFYYVPSGAAGTYEWLDDFEMRNAGTFTLLAGGGLTANGRTNLLSGDILLATTLSVQGEGQIMPRFSGTVTVAGNKTIDFGASGEGVIDWSEATFDGEDATLTFTCQNSSVRAHRLPTAGARIGVKGLRLLDNARVLVNPTNTLEDVFAPIRARGGKITLAGQASQGNWLWLQNGTYRSSDFVATTNTTPGAIGHLVFETTAANQNLTLDGEFVVEPGGPESLYWRIASSGNGAVAGNLTVRGGRLVLHQPVGTESSVARLSGDLRLEDWAIMERLTNSSARTVRLQIEGGGTLYLGDGDAGTTDTITLRGNVINSGGPNEAWGFNADAVVDDGAAILRYVGPSGTTAFDKYAFDWRNAAGVVQAFRGGSAGTVFVLGNLPYNDGFVARGAGVTTFTGPVTVENPYRLTFASNLANQGALHTRTAVALAGASSGMTIRDAGGRVAASSITVSGGAFLAGKGIYDAPVTVNDGSLVPGANGIGTLTVSNLTLSADATLEFELPVKGAVGGGDNDLLTVAGDLVLDGTLLTPVRAGAGEYTIIQYSGTLTDHGLTATGGRVVAGGGQVVVQFSEPGTMVMIR